METPRLLFFKSIGLSHDPFATPVAEQEISSSDDIPNFYSYYQPTTFKKPYRDIGLKYIRQAVKHIFIYGKPGSGKTSLRFALESECRTRQDNTLIVSYTLGEEITRPLSQDEHGARLAEALAVDLFIQVIEQFNPNDPFPNDQQIQILREQVQVGGRRVRRLIDLILDESIPNARAGIGAYWSTISKVPVKFVPRSKPLLQLLNKCQENLEQNPEREKKGWELVKQGLLAANTWGFKKMLILVDGVDTWQRTPQKMMELIQPLLESMPAMGKENIYYRFFLPLELATNVKRHLDLNTSLNSLPILYIIIMWREEALRELLDQRFRAAGSNIIGFNVLADKELNIEQRLTVFSNGSPRRLLRAASSLVDTYLSRKPGNSRITISDWEKMQANWKYE